MNCSRNNIIIIKGAGRFCFSVPIRNSSIIVDYAFIFLSLYLTELEYARFRVLSDGSGEIQHGQQLLWKNNRE